MDLSSYPMHELSLAKVSNWSFLRDHADLLPGLHVRMSSQGYNVQIHNK